MSSTKRKPRIRVNWQNNTIYVDWLPVRVTYAVVVKEFVGDGFAGWDPTETRGPTAHTIIVSNWSSPEQAYTSNNSYAQSATEGATTRYYNYGFEIETGATITQVEVGVEGYELDPSYEVCDVRVSWDGGVTWGPWRDAGLDSLESTKWVDVTADTTWTPAKLTDTNLRVDLRSTLTAAGCFAPDTEVAMWNDDLEKPPKLKKIQNLKEGDEIIGWDPIRRDFVKAKVTSLTQHKGDFEIHHIICRIPDDLFEWAKKRAPDRVKHGPYKDIAVTGSHPVMTVNRGEVEAWDLRVGEDYLWGCFGPEHKIQPILIEEIRYFWVKRVYDLQCTSKFWFKHYLMLVEVK